MLIMAVIIAIAGQAFAVLPGDEIPFSAALGQVVLYGLLMLAAGALAFAVAMLVGRGARDRASASSPCSGCISSRRTRPCRPRSTP